MTGRAKVQVVEASDTLCRLCEKPRKRELLRTAPPLRELRTGPEDLEILRLSFNDHVRIFAFLHAVACLTSSLEIQGGGALRGCG